MAFGSKEGKALLIEPKDRHIFTVHSSVAPARLSWDVAQDIVINGQRTNVGTVHATIKKEGLRRTYYISPLSLDRNKRMSAIMTAGTGHTERGTPLVGMDNVPKAIGGIAINIAQTTNDEELLRLHCLWLETEGKVPPTALQTRVIQLYEAVTKAFPPDVL